MTTKDFYTIFGFNVKMLRVKAGMRQQDLANRLRMSRGSVANIEIGRQGTLLHSVPVIAKALKTTPKTLLKDCW